jgi:hypothetical protein
MQRRRGILWCLFALLALSGQALLVPKTRVSGTGEAHEKVQQDVAIAPGEVAVGVFLGGFRAVVLDILWVRLFDHWQEGDYLGVPPLAEMISTADPRSEMAWVVTSWTLAVQLPAFEPDQDLAWSWVRQGLLHLREGARRLPGSWRIRFEQANLLFNQVFRVPGRTKRYVLDRGLHSEPVDPLEAARRILDETVLLEGHPLYVEILRFQVTLTQAEVFLEANRREAARSLLVAAEAALAALRVDQPEAARDIVLVQSRRVAILREALAD